MRIYVDTSAFYSLLDADDANNRKAVKAWAKLLGHEFVLITNPYVLVETLALVQSRLGLYAVRVFQECILPLVRIEFVSPELHRSAVASVLAAGRRGLRLVDCVSFELMRSAGLRNFFAFGNHFKEQGFVSPA